VKPPQECVGGDLNHAKTVRLASLAGYVFSNSNPPVPHTPISRIAARWNAPLVK